MVDKIKQIFHRFKSNKDYLVVDLGGQQIKLVVGNYSNGKITIKHLIAVPTPSNSFNNGRITNSLEIKQAIEAVLIESNINEINTIATMEHPDIIKREIIIPAVKPEELQEMIQYQVAEYLPIVLEDYVIQHKVLDTFTEEQAEKYKLLVVASPKHIIEEYYNLLTSLQLKAHVLDLHSNGISKLFSQDNFIPIDNLKDKTLAIIHLEEDYMNITILEKNIFKFNRVIAWSPLDEPTVTTEDDDADDINKVVEELIAVTSESKVFDYEGIINNEQHSDKSNAIDKWVREISSSFKYYTSRSHENTIHKIILYGGNSNKEKILTALKEEFFIPIYVLNNLNHVDVKGNNSQQLSIFINAIAALIRN